MKSTTTIITLALICVQYAAAHTYLSSVNGLSEFDTIRPERPTYERNSPIVDISSGDMTCGWLPYASQPANRKLPISAGSSITLQFFHDGPYADDFIIDTSHRGPLMIYLAADSTNPKWFKIWQQGLDSTGKFCTEYLRSDTGVNGAGKGRVKIQIPTYIPSGNYILRTEIIALHEGYAIGKAQFYVNCVELSVTNSAGSGIVSLAAIPTVSMPGTYSVTDPGIFYNLYGSSLPAYIIPGPSVFQPSSTTPTTPVTSAPVTSAPVTSAPVTSAPVTAAPTSKPNAPPTAGPVVTSAPVTPSPTNRPPIAPTTAPTGGTGATINIQIHASSTIWWLALRVAGPSQDTVSVDLKDAGSFSSWTPFSTTNWGYFVFTAGQITVPASLRLTSASGVVVELDYILGAVTPGAVINTAATYGGSAAPVTSAPVTYPPVTSAPVTSAPVTYPPVTSAPVTSAPVTSAPVTAAPSTKPNAPPTAGPATQAPATTKVQVHAGSSAWWFAVAIVDHPGKTVASVQVQDSTTAATYVNLSPSDWGYWVYQTQGKPLIAPLSIRVTSTVGTSVVVTNVPISPSVTSASSQL